MENLQQIIWLEITEALNQILMSAVDSAATDIHIEPSKNDYRLRFRIDGNLLTVLTNFPKAKALQLISRIKVLSKLDISESRSCQDGSFRFDNKHRNTHQDIRVATAATNHGERVTLRILGVNTNSLTINRLGFSNNLVDRIQNIISKQAGFFLVTGPTGSGKSTTLYAALRERNNDDTNIMTIEDPIEYSIEGVSQLQVDQAGKITFPLALRSMLRHDPDVIMVGEIRDSETAQIALRAAMTGHMVFSTLHTTSAPNTITRLVDMGCEPYLVAATLSGCLAQRLVKKLCNNCKSVRKTSDDEKNATGLTEVAFSEGCDMCNNKGYRGRIAITEFLEVDSNLRKILRHETDASEILTNAKYYQSMKQDALEKLNAGLVDIQEVMTILPEH